MRLGDLELYILVAGRWKADGGLMFGVVPKVLWEKQKLADGNNMIDMACVGLVARLNGKVIVCETGIGTKLSEKRARQSQVWEPDADQPAQWKRVEQAVVEDHAASIRNPEVEACVWRRHPRAGIANIARRADVSTAVYMTQAQIDIRIHRIGNRIFTEQPRAALRPEAAPAIDPDFRRCNRCVANL